VEGGQQCQGDDEDRVVSGSGPSTTVRHEWIIVCARPGDDRTLYFLLSEAVDTSLQRLTTAQIGSTSEWPNNAQDPITTDWTVKGGGYLGKIRLVGTNGAGTLSIAVSLDLGPS
jgi:hypothetical protein